MEKIQAAIAKARAERQDPGGREDVPAPERVAPPPVADPAGIAAWEALTPVAPAPAHLARHRIMTGGRGPEATAFDVLRTRLLQQLRPNGWHRVAITSPDAQCGKSMVALNLALSLARLPEQRVFLAELDLRRPSLANVLGLRGAHDFASVLTGETPFSEAAIRIGSTLMVGANNGPTARAAELLQSPRARTAMAEIEATYAPTVVIYDMPPIQAGDDVMAAIGLADCALLVAAAGKTKIAQVDNCERTLAEQTNVLGVILNKCRYLDRSESYGY